MFAMFIWFSGLDANECSLLFQVHPLNLPAGLLENPMTTKAWRTAWKLSSTMNIQGK